jgi:hypothetical protein
MKSIHAAAVLVTAMATMGGCGIATSAPSSSGSPSPTPAAPTIQSSPTPEPSGTAGVVTAAWTSASPMHFGRVGSDALVLTDGTVLVLGDDHDCQPGGAVPGSERAEVYDPAADRWTEVGSLNKGRKSPATVALPDGTAITMGGINPDDFPFSSTKVFSPVTGTWADGPLLNLARGFPLAAGLGDGRVLVASQDGGVDFGATVEILDPAIGTWIRAATPGPSTSLSHLVLLDDGKVLALGTSFADLDPVYAAWLYDPAAALWEPAPAPVIRPTHLLAVPNGAVVLGFSDESELTGGSGGPSRAVGMYLDRALGHWAPIAPMPTPRFEPQAVTLADGRVLAAGGRSTPDDNGPDGAVVPTAEVYDPVTDSWSTTTELLAPRQDGHSLLLADGTVLVLGGNDQLNRFGDTPFCPPGLTSVELFRLAP